jgi:hypothetical protein
MSKKPFLLKGYLRDVSSQWPLFSWISRDYWSHGPCLCNGANSLPGNFNERALAGDLDDPAFVENFLFLGDVGTFCTLFYYTEQMYPSILMRFSPWT